MILITSGCSFTETIHEQTWPLHLQEALNCKLVSTARGSQGNGIIARKAMYHVHQLLKKHSANEILVGIMWSGFDRAEIYLPRSADLQIDSIEKKGMQENPVTFPDNDTIGKWALLNAHWRFPLARMYYKHVHSSTYGQIVALDNIVKVQNYLKLHNIKYFMSTYTKQTLLFDFKNENIQWLWEQVDRTMFLPVEGCFEWANTNMPNDFPIPNTNHPSKKQHREFTKQVILPFLEEKYNIKKRFDI